MRKVELSMEQHIKYKTIKKLIENNGNKNRAAATLHISKRHLNRLIKGFIESGHKKEFFLHGNYGRKPIHTINQDLKNLIEELYITKYFDCSYSQFTEFLAERENIFLSVSCVGNILRERCCFSPKVHKSTKKRYTHELKKMLKEAKNKKDYSKYQAKLVALQDAHPRQPRCEHFGEEIQMDACIHTWFNNTKTTLHAAIDDSTGRIVGAYFAKQETLEGYYNVFNQILENYGIPMLFKTDKRTVFEYNKKGTNLDEDNTFTQFSYACEQLGVQIETSSTPQFKPRIERLFESLQSRLIPELRLAQIKTIEKANEFLLSYIEKYNSQFGLCINHTKSFFENQPSKERINLILSVISRRIIDCGHSIKYKNKYYRIVNSVGFPIFYGKGTKCLVVESFNKELFAVIENNVFSMEEIPEYQKASEDLTTIIHEPKRIYVPQMYHPWKQKSFETFIKKLEKRLNKIKDEFYA